LRIIQVIPTLGLGGAEKFVVSLANAMAKVKSNEVFLVTLFGPDDPSNNILKSSIDDGVQLIQFNKKVGLDLRVMRAVYNKMKTLNPDVINLHVSAIIYFLPFIFLNKNCKYFNTIHTYPQREHQSKLLKSIKKRLNDKNRLRLITLTKINAINAEKIYKTTNVKYIDNGVVKPSLGDTSALRKKIIDLKQNSDSLVITHVGRISEVKNQKMLIAAFKELYAENVNVCLLFIGYASPEDQALKEDLLSDLTPNIHFLGKQTNIFEYLSCSDGFTLTSHFEGFPISMIEALAVGAIPLCVPAGGIPDIIQSGYNGFVTKDSTMESYLAMMRAFAKLSTTERATLKQNCLNTFKEKYEISKIADRYLEYYHSA